MTTYIVLLILTTLFAYFADKLFYSYRGLSIFFIVAIGVVYTIIAGFRDFGIGIDTNIYIEEYFKTAKSLISVTEYLSIETKHSISLETIDKGFLFLCWVSSLISSDKQIVLVVVELWIISFTMLGVYMLKKDYGMKIWIFVFIYFFMFFGYSINLMRQFCAMSLLFWGFVWLKNGNWKVYAITQLAAYYFHSSSVVFLLVPMVYFLSHLKNIRIRNFITVVSIAAFGIIFSSLFYFLTLIGKLGILSEVYSERYGKDSEFQATAGFSFFITLSYLITFFLLYLIHKKKIMKATDTYILSALYIISFILSQLSYITPYLERLSYYISLVFLLYIVNALGNKRIPLWLRVSFVSFTIILCHRIFVVNLGAKIYPYTSKILEIY